MVKKLFLVLTLAVVAYLASACGGDGNNTAAGPKPTVTNTPLAQVFRATIVPETGPPGTEVTITGTGWGPGLPVSITADNAETNSKPYSEVTSLADGTFTAKFRLEKTPGGAELKQGRLNLIVAGFKGNTTISFTVEPPRPPRPSGAGG
jgi:hypothetical protein